MTENMPETTPTPLDTVPETLPPLAGADTVDHPSQPEDEPPHDPPTDDPTVGDPGHDVPTGSTDEVYAWVVGDVDDDPAAVEARQLAALAAEKAKPTEDQDADLIALLSPQAGDGDGHHVEKVDLGDPDPDPAPTDVTAPADQQGATPTV